MLAQTSTETWVNTPRTLAARNLSQFLDAANAVVFKNAAPELIRETIGIEPRDLYFVIHVVRFSEGGEIGWPAKQTGGRCLSDDVADFAAEIFARNGALFCGPGGDRFVYELEEQHFTESPAAVIRIDR